MKFNLNYILIAGFLFFSFVSALTTGLGVLLVMDSFAPIVKWLTAIGIALGTSLVMIYLGLKVNTYSKQGKLHLVIISYFFVAILSVFFNFHAFYSGQIISNSNYEDGQELKKNIINVAQNSKPIIQKSLNVDSLRFKEADLRGEMKAEQFNKIAPGKGPEWQKRHIEWQKVSQKLTVQEELLKNELKNIEKIAQNSLDSLDVIPIVSNEYRKQKILSLGENSFNQIVSTIKSYDNNYIAPELTLISSDVGSPGFALQRFTDFLTGKGSAKEKAQYRLSFAISLLLDFPMFLTLLLIGRVVDNPNETNSTKLKDNVKKQNSNHKDKLDNMEKDAPIEYPIRRKDLEGKSNSQRKDSKKSDLDNLW